MGWSAGLEGGKLRPEDGPMCDVVVESPYYGRVRIPGYIRAAFGRWAKSPEFPRDVPIRIEDGKLIVNVRRPEDRPPPDKSGDPPAPAKGKSGKRATQSKKRAASRKRKDQEDGSLVIEYDRR